MIGYEAYLSQNPKVSRNRAEKLMEEGICYFLKYSGEDEALLPRNSSYDELVTANLSHLYCSCNVYATKRACSHIAAALGLVEKNGGAIPYTEPVSHVNSCLNQLVEHKKGMAYFAGQCFMRDVKPFLDLLPKDEQAAFLLRVALYLETPKSLLTPDQFLECYMIMVSWGRKNAAITQKLFQNRQDCYEAVVTLLVRASHEGTFTKAQRQTIVKEIAADDALTKKYIFLLADGYGEAFSREQLLAYYGTLKQGQVRPLFLTKLLNKLIEEEPPMFEAFIQTFNSAKDTENVRLEPSVIAKLVQAGYEDQMGKVVDAMVARMRGLDEYENIIQFVSHEMFLSSWKKRIQAKESRWYSWQPEDWEIEVSFRENPEEDPEDYYLEVLSCHLLSVILEVRPDAREIVNQAARKIYRKAVKENDRTNAVAALMVLMQGEDNIAVKYASDWHFDQNMDENMIYRVAVGRHFDSLQKMFPELKEMEGSHAAGQD